MMSTERELQPPSADDLVCDLHPTRSKVSSRLLEFRNYTASQASRSRHEQTEVEVGVSVDVAIAPFVALLRGAGLQTIASCQGYVGGKRAYVMGVEPTPMDAGWSAGAILGHLTSVGVDVEECSVVRYYYDSRRRWAYIVRWPASANAAVGTLDRWQIDA